MMIYAFAKLIYIILQDAKIAHLIPSTCFTVPINLDLKPPNPPKSDIVLSAIVPPEELEVFPPPPPPPAR